MNEEIRQWLISIIHEGNQSPYKDELAGLFVQIALRYLSNGNDFPYDRRQKIYQDNSIYDDTEEKRLKSLALMCIAELFDLDENNKCYQINDCFAEIDLHTAFIEEIVSELVSLIFSTCHDFIYDCSDINYKRLRNALNNCLRRYSFYRTDFVNRKKHVFTAEFQADEIRKPQIEKDKLTKLLFMYKLKNPSACKLLYLVFEIINNQEEFCRIVYYNIIVQSILEYMNKISIGNPEETRDLPDMDEEEREPQKDKTVMFMDPFLFIEEFADGLKNVIKLNRYFKQITQNGKLYIHTCKKSEVRFDLEQYPVEVMISELNNKNLNSDKILVILKLLFDILNRQNLYNKAMLYNNLEKILLQYYLKN
jgi:hypothetical protein